MKDLDAINDLIDKAKSIAGSDAALARTLGVVPQRIANWRNGSAGCSLEDQALLAAAAGLDPLQELARAAVRKHEGTGKGDRLMGALGKGLLATGGALVSAGANAAVIFSSIPAPVHALEWTLAAVYTMCIMLNNGPSQSGTLRQATGPGNQYLPIRATLSALITRFGPSQTSARRIRAFHGAWSERLAP